MGLPTVAKKVVKDRNPKSFGYTCPKDVGILTVDAMQFFKGSIPDFIKTNEQLIFYFVNIFLKLLTICPTVVIRTDIATPDPKKVGAHVNRYEIRCKECKKLGRELPNGRKAGPEYFAPNCTKKCYELQTLYPEDGPHMQEDNSSPLNFNYTAFSNNTENLRRELWPRIVNRLLGVKLKPGQYLYLNGFPLNVQKMQSIPNNESYTVDYWYAHQLPLKSYDCGHTLCISSDVPFPYIDGRMYNQIHEADHAVFWFLQFFPQHRVQMVYINDGDAISIGLTVALEYIHTFTELHLCLPTRQDATPYEYVDMTMLCRSIEEAPEFKRANVVSPTMCYVLLLTLAGTDFFEKICPGIGFICEITDDDAGKEEEEDNKKRKRKPTPGIWDTFMQNLSMFSHLIQFYRGSPSVTTKKRAVIDRDLFKIFIQHCYMNKYGESAKKKHKKDNITFDTIQLYCSSLKKKEFHCPSNNELDCILARLDWNIEYILNDWRGHYPDPCETYEGLSYYGYTRDPVFAKVDIVASKQKDLDENYKRHFLKRKKKEEQQPSSVVISQKRKQNALDKLKGF